MKHKVEWNGKTLFVEFLTYESGRAAITLVDLNGEIAIIASSNLPHIPLGPKEAFIKDYSENEGILSALVKAGIVERTGRKADSGFVSLPVVRILI
jgi:hypothetical protein